MVKTLNLIKDESAFRKTIRKDNNYWIEHPNISRVFLEDKFIEKLSFGPSGEDLINENYIKKDMELEKLKIGDIFPCYFCINNISLTVDYIPDTSCEVVILKLSDIQELLPVRIFLMFF